MGSFADLRVQDKISYTKNELCNLVKNIFENPEVLKTYIDEKKLTNEQSKIILDAVNKLNAKNCACCRRYDQTKLRLTPIEKDLEPLLEIAQSNAKAKAY